MLFGRLQGDRFIPDRSAMDMDVAYYLLTETRKEKENAAAASPSKEAYRKLLAENILKNRTRILAFRNKPPAPAQPFFHEADVVSSHHVKPAKQRRYIPQVIFFALPSGLLYSRATFCSLGCCFSYRSWQILVDVFSQQRGP